MIEYPPHTETRASRRRLAFDASWLGPRTMVIGSALLVALALFVRPVTDTDLWLHLVTGRWIVEHGALPAHDLFTYTVPDHRWVNHEYLSEVLLYLTSARFGLAGVSVAGGLVAWSGFLLVAAACRPGERPYPIVGLALVLAAVAGAPIWGARPQMVTFAFVALELLWLRRALEGESRAILWLPAAMVLWSNLHGGWPLGLLFVGVAVVAELIRWIADRSPDHLRHIRLLALTGGLSLVAVGINPNGPAIYLYPFQTLTSSAQQGLILEWASPDFHLAGLRPFELMVLLTIGGITLGRARLFDALVALAGLALALESVRHVPLFVAAATPLLVATWTDAWRRLGAPALAAARVTPRWGPAVGAALLLAVAAVVGARLAGDLGRQPQLTARAVPVGAADWLAAHPDTGTRMFNDYAWSGYLADRFSPDPNRRLFVLSEGVLMGDAQLLRYEDVASLRPRWRSILDEDRVDYIVFERDSALDDVLRTDPGWRLAYQDRTAVIYLRTTTAP